MPILDEPKYPVIDAEPSISRVVSNFNASDWQTWAGSTAGTAVLGYLSTSGAYRMHRPSAVMGGIVGGLGGYMIAYQRSWGRLVGLNENSADVAANQPRFSRMPFE
mmetsp:Transcript_8480/g.9861  ORF Transcript_8480/g.9861 Transcript_8480/m.9861 type:complete len:106 (-) Transcript_8480:244-561(-)|eukprot:CAMPEP_0197852780 /NCGR_PEP_ID=MMETSP1438-20131217/21376_1 /TAXON_ID=1461541 /ORGANISM="Pterosperma sp., Strain CCMP1384" /LENGTH=105 /DNA_ID=CAMNT_0043466955 /DNA_START=89 /DNA_END=406 /DNA_ORIENTATION=+